jgi:hypothetical protein
MVTTTDANLLGAPIVNKSVRGEEREKGGAHKIIIARRAPTVKFVLASRGLEDGRKTVSFSRSLFKYNKYIDGVYLLSLRMVYVN